MRHWVVLPVLLPLLAAMLCLLLRKRQLGLRRVVGGVTLAMLVAGSVKLLHAAHDGTITTYSLGNWPAPYGIVFVVDRLSALMVALASVLALPSFAYAAMGPDRRSPDFQFLFLMLVAGVNGAFLTGDLFNLFVFFEIVLLTSYVLVMHGGGAARTRAGLHYVVLNLIGSSLFLVGVGTLYGVTGTLNMADMAVKLGQVAPGDAMLARSGALLMLVVFATKAGMFPVYFWLPRAYASASAPVAALFSIMTKVGVYALLRSSTLVFGPGTGPTDRLALPYLLPMSLLTLALGVIGALAARKLRSMTAYLLLVSVATILAGVGLFNEAGIAAALYYLLHSTLVMAALFLLADLVCIERGPEHLDRLTRGPAVSRPVLLGSLFLLTMIGVAGLPPASGFLGKVLLLQASLGSPLQPLLWGVVLVGSFLSLVAISRAGTNLFWKTDEPTAGPRAATGWRALPVVGLLLAIGGLSVLAGPVDAFTRATAAQLLRPSQYLERVLATEDVAPGALAAPGRTPLSRSEVAP